MPVPDHRLFAHDTSRIQPFAWTCTAKLSPGTHDHAPGFLWPCPIASAPALLLLPLLPCHSRTCIPPLFFLALTTCIQACACSLSSLPTSSTAMAAHLGVSLNLWSALGDSLHHSLAASSDKDLLPQVFGQVSSCPKTLSCLPSDLYLRKFFSRHTYKLGKCYSTELQRPQLIWYCLLILPVCLGPALASYHRYRLENLWGGNKRCTLMF